MAKKYVVTGGPGVGKTSIILKLEQRGEHVIRECAEDFIRAQQAKGIREPWLDPDFQNKLLEIHLRRERITKGLNNRVFIDGGLMDFFVYYRLNGQVIDESNRDIILTETKSHPYEKVFFVMGLGNYETTAIRRETMKEALIIGQMIREEYQSWGFNILDVPPVELNKRVNFVLSNL